MKKTIGIMMILLVSLGLTTLGLAMDQKVTVNIPPTSTLTLSAGVADIIFPSIDTWNSDTYTKTSDSFDIITYHNGSANPDIQVTSTALTNGTGTGAPTIPLANFIVNVTPQGGSHVSGPLSGTVNVSDVGKGHKIASANYALTISNDQESGIYTGTVTYTLLNQ